MLPLVLDLREKRVVVFGGGDVGLRKAKYFEDEADVVVVSREFHPGFDSLRVRRIKGEAMDHVHELVDGSDIVIAATDDESLNLTICDIAKENGKLYNQAHGVGNFLIPSVVNKGSYLVAISTMGRSPALSRFIRERLDSELEDELESMVQLLQELRSELKATVNDQEDREKILLSVLDDEETWKLLEVSYQRAMDRAKMLVRRQDG